MADKVIVLTSAAGVSDAQVAAVLSGVAADAPRRMSACAVEARARGALPPLAHPGIDVNVVPKYERI